MEHARESYQISERHACRLLGQWRGTQRYEVLYRTDEDALTRDIVALASEYGRYGYRRITALLQAHGWHVGKDRVQRIWRREGLKVPQRQRPRGRLWSVSYTHLVCSRRFVGRNRKSRRREAAGRRNYPEAVPNGEARNGELSLIHI